VEQSGQDEEAPDAKRNSRADLSNAEMLMRFSFIIPPDGQTLKSEYVLDRLV
jgi:hypothetical protein